MTLRLLFATALALSLCACTPADPSAPAVAADGAAVAEAPVAEALSDAAEAPARGGRELAEGSLDFALTARTIESNSRGDANSVQCQMDFKASNRSQAQVKSVVAEFRIASGDQVIATDSTLVMPFEIPPGQTRDAWGPIVIDDHRCADLDVRVQPATVGMCRTKDKGPCPAYQLSAEGLGSTG
ncbi:hypothetical protein [Arenimonas sp. MALMAid1274]|uniref:hypothetical protein n=1 Tax=Arenimonas sp. MALMAid1274 TaxID=3411630 RepID=UPI003BA3D961